MRELLLLRHGITVHNEKGVFTGGTDVPLSREGKRRLAAARDRYPPAARFFTSGMRRAVQTLEILYGPVPWTAIEQLAEYDFGRFAGKGHDALYEKNAQYRRWLADDAVAPPGGESRSAFTARVASGWAALITHRWDGLAVLISHGGVLTQLMRQYAPLHGEPATPPNGGGWRVRLDGRGRITGWEVFP